MNRQQKRALIYHAKHPMAKRSVEMLDFMKRIATMNIVQLMLLRKWARKETK